MILLSLWDSLNVFKLSHSSVLKVVGMKLKLDSWSTSNFDFIIIIKLLAQVVNFFSNFLQNKKWFILCQNHSHTMIYMNVISK
jgi:hypothetical protein